jgi:hypothetical protein
LPQVLPFYSDSLKTERSGFFLGKALSYATYFVV